jgi:hypothetical protein
MVCCVWDQLLADTYLIAHEWLHSEALWETEHNIDINISLLMVYEDYMTLFAFERVPWERMGDREAEIATC